MPIYDEGSEIHEKWDKIGQRLLAYLTIEKFPLLFSHESGCLGIIICQVRYRNEKGEVKTRWITVTEPFKKKYHLIAWCQWTFLPLSIGPRKRSMLPEDQRYCYLMKIEQGEIQENTQKLLKCYIAKIVTAKNGALLKKEDVDVASGENDSLKYKFAFPRQLVSKINKCLANNFFPELWLGPSCAAWHRTDEGRAFYLGIPSISRMPELRQFFDLMNGPNGDAASVLLAYTCFSILKSFFPSYHILHKDARYYEAKKNIPKQIALNIWSGHVAYVEKLADVCCGYFRNFEAGEDRKKSMPIADGIVIQTTPSKVKKLGVNEFESKVLQPACVLWMNREPARELVESGELLNIQIPAPVEDNDDILLSEFIVYALAYKMHERTTYAFGKRFDTDWKKSVPIVKNFLERLRERTDLQFGESSLESQVMQEELNDFREAKSEPCDLLLWLKQAKSHITVEIDRTLEQQTVQDSRIISQLEEYRQQVEKMFAECVKEIRKIHKKNTRLLYSLDSVYIKTMKKLMENQSVSLMGQEIAKKIAYLSTSFRVFAKLTMPEAECNSLCDRVDLALISAFQRQLGIQSATGILEKYLLNLLEKGQCARIRGEGSDSSSIRVWYDPKGAGERGIFLIPSKNYFNNVKDYYPTRNINKSEFETSLADMGVLDTLSRKKQKRRTFEAVVQKGGRKQSVLKINADALSDRFFEKAQRCLNQMKADNTSYRSRCS